MAEQELGDILAVAEQLRKNDRHEPDDSEHQRRRDQAAPIGRADPIGPCDRAHEGDRCEADQRRGDDRPEVDVGRDGEDRNSVEGLVGHDESRRLGRDQRGGEGGQDEAQRQRPAQHFEGENRAPERHAIDRRHAGAGADRDYEAALFVREHSAGSRTDCRTPRRTAWARLRDRAERPCRR